MQYVLYLAILVLLAIPLGTYIEKVMNGKRTFLSKILTPCENVIYKVLHIKTDEQMNWKKYAVSVGVFSGIGLLAVMLLQMLQGVLPGNPQNLPGVKWDLSFNTAASFITNTNWQAYTGEAVLSYLTQAVGLTVQNFVSAATGAVLFALIRGFIKVKTDGLGSFWVDMTRIVVHILIPAESGGLDVPGRRGRGSRTWRAPNPWRWSNRLRSARKVKSSKAPRPYRNRGSDRGRPDRRGSR